MFVLIGAAFAEVEIPPVARVTDLTGTLTSSQQAALAQRLAAFEQAKGSQIAVLIVPTTQPETIEQYALRVAESWKLGRDDVDDGVLLLVARNDRALRIEVGYGLEGAIPDAVARRVIEEIMLPRFRDGDMPGGVVAGVESLVGLVSGEALPAPQSVSVLGKLWAHPLVRWALTLLGLPLLAVVAGRSTRARWGRYRVGWLCTGLAFAPWAVAFGTIMFSDGPLQSTALAATVLGVGALVGCVIFAVVVDDPKWKGVYRTGRSAYGASGGYSSSSSGSYSSSGSSSSGSGFSGGGGSFGGGGASGRW